MRVLALDTATEACSAAILTDAGVIGVAQEAGRGHADLILSMVDGLLAQAGLTLGQMDGIAAGVGPGSFTGVRIGVSVAQGLAYGAGLPVVAVSTLEALAWQCLQGQAGDVLACLDARMGEVYWGCFTADGKRGLVARGASAVGSAAAVAVPFAGPFQGIGRGFAAYPTLASLPGLVLPPGAAAALPDARDMSRLGRIRLQAGEGRDPADLEPLYLRDKVALTELERRASRPAGAI